MLHFYDGQIRRYLLQTIRVFSNFTVKYGDGRIVRIPVVYGDPDRQAAAIMRQNSENKINSTPRIAVYITGLSMDPSRLADSTFIGKVHVREREYDETTGEYTGEQGGNYTVERLMPTPFTLKMKCDIWASSTDQKLQILEQILVLFNPTLELQTTDNYVDWTSLSVLEIKNLTWSSRSIPVGVDTPIDIATLEVETPIWINPPVKIKQMGVITQIITSLQQGITGPEDSYIDGMGTDPIADGARAGIQIVTQVATNIAGYGVQVYNGQAQLLASGENAIGDDPNEIPIKQGNPISWFNILDQYPGQYKAGYSQIFVKQPAGNEVIGTIALHPDDDTLLIVNWDSDTYPSNTDITTNSRPSSSGTFDAIINPLTFNPKRPNKEGSDQIIVTGRRYLIVENIGDVINDDGPDAWKSTTGVDFVAKENDIIEYTGTTWTIVFAAADHQEDVSPTYQTNIYTGVQYKWDGIAWTKSFEGEYKEGGWRLRL